MNGTGGRCPFCKEALVWDEERRSWVCRPCHFVDRKW